MCVKNLTPMTKIPHLHDFPKASFHWNDRNVHSYRWVQLDQLKVQKLSSRQTLPLKFSITYYVRSGFYYWGSSSCPQAASGLWATLHIKWPLYHGLINAITIMWKLCDESSEKDKLKLTRKRGWGGEGRGKEKRKSSQLLDQRVHEADRTWGKRRLVCKCSQQLYW